MARVFRITDATTRLLTDGELEKWTSSSALTNWTATGSPTVARSTSNVKEGVYSARIRNVSTQAVRGIYQDVSGAEIISGKTYYVRCWVYVAAGTVRLYAWDGGGTSNAVYEETAVTGWRQLIVKKVAASTGIRIGLIAYSASADGYFDLVQIATGHIEFIEGVEDATFRITNWRQNMPVEKGGGIFQDSPIADGRELIDSYWSNTQDTIEFNVLGISTETQDTIIAKWRELLQLIQKANSYGKTSWQYDPVYVEAKAGSETNYRYTRIIYANIPDAEDMFHITFLQLAMLGINLNVEHGHWMGLPPETDIGVEIEVSESYNSRTLGYGSATKEIGNAFIVNKNNVANLTHIYNYDSSGTSYSSNLMDAALPHDLWPSAMANNDAIYFGSSTAVDDSGPFNNIIFDIATAATYSGINSTVWEYYNGSAWATLTVEDNTDGANGALEETGILSVHWDQPSNWAANAINGVTAFWVRLRMGTIGRTGTKATQQNRKIYSVTKSYYDIDMAQIVGDISALARYRYNTATPVDSIVDKAIIGIRSNIRGDSFRAIINISDEQNESVTVSASLQTTLATDSTTPTGRRATYNPTAIEDYDERVSILLTSPEDWRGQYHAFVRAKQTSGNVGDINIRLTLEALTGGLLFIGESSSLLVNDFTLVDLGIFSFPTQIKTSEPIANGRIVIEANCTVSSSIPDAYFYDLILIPIDEWAGEFLNTRPDADGGELSKLEIDSNTLARSNLRVLNKTADGEVSSIWRAISNGSAIMQRSQDQRVWSLFAKLYRSTGTHTGSSGASTLTDSAANFVGEGVEVGMIINNTTDGSHGTITALTATTITATLRNGTDNDWDNGDAYSILTNKYEARPTSVYSVAASNVARYLSMRGNT